MGYSEFVEWAAYVEIEPVGGLRGDMHAAIIASTIANANRRKSGKRIKPSEFIPDFWRDGSSPAALIRKLQSAERGAKRQAQADALRNTYRRSRRRIKGV